MTSQVPVARLGTTADHPDPGATAISPGPGHPSKTGEPAVDAALERLEDLPGADLADGAEILRDVLDRLERVLAEEPRE